MGWFGRKTAGGAPRPLLLRAGWGAAGAMPVVRSYEAQVREAYLANAVAQRCVRLVAEAVGSVTLFGEGAEAKDDPLPTNSGQASTGSGKAVSLLCSGMLETVATHLLLHGNAFVQIGQDGEGMPARLFALRPERVKVEADAVGWPVAYRYKAGAADADRVIRMFERLIRRGRERAEARAAARRLELAERLAAAAPGGVEVVREGEAVVLRGRGLIRRLTTEADLRWLVTEVRDG